jgi:hypothetical protein
LKSLLKHGARQITVIIVSICDKIKPFVSLGIGLKLTSMLLNIHGSGFRLDFCDDTIDKANSTIGDALAFSIREGFFEKVLEDDLYENAVQVSTLFWD